MRKTLSYESSFVSGPLGVEPCTFLTCMCGCHSLIFGVGDDAPDLNMKFVEIHTVHCFANG